MDVLGLGQRRDLLYPSLETGMAGAGLVRRDSMGHGVSATPKGSVGPQAYPGHGEYGPVMAEIAQLSFKINSLPERGYPVLQLP